jgi:hypothetical protein
VHPYNCQRTAAGNLNCPWTVAYFSTFTSAGGPNGIMPCLPLNMHALPALSHCTIPLHVQGCMVLLLGDHRAFFTMYRAITDAGLRAYQLDRDGALLKAGLQACSFSCSNGIISSCQPAYGPSATEQFSILVS